MPSITHLPKLILTFWWLTCNYDICFLCHTFLHNTFVYLLMQQHAFPNLNIFLKLLSEAQNLTSLIGCNITLLW